MEPEDETPIKLGQLWRAKTNPYTSKGEHYFLCKPYKRFKENPTSEPAAKPTNRLEILPGTIVMVTKTEEKHLKYDGAHLVLDLVAGERVYEEVVTLPSSWRLRFELVSK